MYLCVLDADGRIVLHRKLPCRPEAFLAAVEPFRASLVVGCECLFSWYWLADLCAEAGIDFVLGHALGMRLIHGTKTKNDKLDSEKIARLLHSGHFPLAYVYPKARRATRDLLRRRLYFVRRRADLLTHLQIVEAQYNLEPGRGRLERALVRTAKVDDLDSFCRLRTVPGIGESLAMTLLYEVPDFDRFDTVGEFASYGRLVAPRGESSGKLGAARGRKQGNVHLKWAFSEAAVLLLRENPRAQKLHDRLVRRFGKAKALSVLAHKLGRTVFFMQKRHHPFDAERFYAEG